MSIKNITALVEDVDGVHTNEYQAGGEFNDLCDEAYLQAVIQILPQDTQIDIPDIKKLARNSYNQHRNSITGLLPLGPQFGIPQEEFRVQLFDLGHQLLFQLAENKFPTLTEPCPQTIAAMQRLNDSLQHGTATHSSAEYWAKPLFRKKGILQFFKDAAMVDHKAVDFENKNRSARAIRTALEKLDVPACRAAFLEDTADHLRVAKEAFPDLTTVLITHGRHVEKPAYVDIVETNPLTLMENIERARTETVGRAHPQQSL